MRFCDYFNQRLELLKIDRSEIEKELGVSRQAISKWATGQSLPDIKLFPALADILSTDPYELVDLVWDRPFLTRPSKKIEYVLKATSNITDHFNPDSVSQLELKSFLVVCSRNEMDSFMRKYAKRLHVALLSPTVEKNRIIKNKLPGWTLYSIKDLISFFLLDCKSSFSDNSKPFCETREMAWTLINSKYLEILSWSRIKTLVQSDSILYDSAHKELCEELVHAEADVLLNPIFEDVFSDTKNHGFFHAQYALNFVMHKLVNYGQISGDFNTNVLHSIIKRKDIERNGFSLSSYDGYLFAQNKILESALKQGFSSRFDLDEMTIEARINLLGFKDDNDYKDYLMTLSNIALNQELARSRWIKNETETILESAVKTIDDFIKENFLHKWQRDTRHNDQLSGYNPVTALENQVRRAENDEEFCAKCVRGRLNRLYNEYDNLIKKIAELKSYCDDIETSDINDSDNCIEMILDIRHMLLGRTGGLDGSFNRLATLANDLGVHVSSWYYHLFGKNIDRRQTVTARRAGEMLVIKDSNGNISYPDTVKIIKKEFEEMLRKIDI